MEMRDRGGEALIIVYIVVAVSYLYITAITRELYAHDEKLVIMINNTSFVVVISLIAVILFYSLAAILQQQQSDKR